MDRHYPNESKGGRLRNVSAMTCSRLWWWHRAPTSGHHWTIWPVRRPSSRGTFSAYHRLPSPPGTHRFARHSCRLLCQCRLDLIDLYSNVCDDNGGDADVGVALCSSCVWDMERPASIVCSVAEAARASMSPDSRTSRSVIRSAAAIELLCSWTQVGTATRCGQKKEEEKDPKTTSK